jgi:hypothetical protein
MNGLTIVGQPFKVAYSCRRNKSGKASVKCVVVECGECGQRVVMHTSKVHLNRSCGCVHTKHGMCGSRAYNAWKAAVQRCTNKNNPKFALYGGRGIEVCDRWMEFSNFYTDMGDPGHGMSLDRIDSDKGYCPENCRWTDIVTQNRNTSRNHILTVDGRSACVSEWSKMTGLSVSKMFGRISLGWTDSEVVFGKGDT